MTSFSSSLSSHRVLARKYRPSTLKDMIGQEGLVQVLTNGIQKGRLPHAFILTGIRGVGKTTTARIIARALNCVGSDGQGEPTPFPCGVCESCKAIAEDRHIDVIEMDAASRTSVEDVRDIIEGSRYKAVSARFKVYIVDEVHMLSRHAFNAFLKTLEEPPPHVKFIFATTDLEKVPDTILSRCMRLPLQRIEADVLIAYFSKITGQEGLAIEPGALALIARAAEGSARDGLSLLDQAMILCEEGIITEAAVLEMLGLGDRRLVFKIFKGCMEGTPEAVLSHFHKMHLSGSDPVMVLRDLLDFTHWTLLEKNKIAGDGNPAGLVAEEISEAQSLVASLSFSCLSRCWQVLLKGLDEAAAAPSPRQAVDIILLRLCYLAALPTPDKIIQCLKKDSPRRDQEALPPLKEKSPSQQPVLASPKERVVSLPPLSSSPAPETFDALLALCAQRREMLLKGYLENDTHLISYTPGEIVLRFLPGVPKETTKRLRDLLTEWTGISWIVTLGSGKGAPTRREKVQKEREEIRTQILEEPFMQTALKVFPDAEIEYIEDHI